jgi:hypothetical protein
MRAPDGAFCFRAPLLPPRRAARQRRKKARNHPPGRPFWPKRAARPFTAAFCAEYTHVNADEFRVRIRPAVSVRPRQNARINQLFLRFCSLAGQKNHLRHPRTLHFVRVYSCRHSCACCPRLAAVPRDRPRRTARRRAPHRPSSGAPKARGAAHRRFLTTPKAAPRRF